MTCFPRDRRPPEQGHFDELYYRGLGRNLHRLEKLVREAPIDDLAVFDRRALLRHLEEASLVARLPPRKSPP